MSDQTFDPSQMPGASWPLPTTYTYGHTHSHLWHAIGVQESPREADVTVALLRCTICADVTAKELPGAWTLEQVRGEAVAETAAR
jgi:hypothetical protein